MSIVQFHWRTSRMRRNKFFSNLTGDALCLCFITPCTVSYRLPFIFLKSDVQPEMVIFNLQTPRSDHSFNPATNFRSVFVKIVLWFTAFGYSHVSYTQINMSGREGGKKKPLKAAKKDGKVRNSGSVCLSFVKNSRDKKHSIFFRNSTRKTSPSSRSRRKNRRSLKRWKPRPVEKAHSSAAVSRSRERNKSITPGSPATYPSSLSFSTLNTKLFVIILMVYAK